MFSKDAFDFEDVDRYLQNILTTSRNCKNAKTGGGKSALFSPRSDPKPLFDKKSLSCVIHLGNTAKCLYVLTKPFEYSYICEDPM